MKINKNLMGQNHTPIKRSKDQIQWIVVHYVGALGDAKACTDYYKNEYVGASADFFVGHAGDVWQGNDYWNYYSWHCGGGYQSYWTKDGGGRYYGICTNANSVGIEMCVRKRSTATMNATDTDWYFEQATVDSTIELVKHLMTELDIDIDHVIRHYDVNRKICPNPYVIDYQAWLDFKAAVSGPVELLHAKQLNGLSEEQKIEKMAPLYQAEQKRSGMLASVGLAQFCLESGYGTTDLAQEADNLHGMKCNLSGNSWAGSSWDGKSKYTKRTAEQTASGEVYYVTADFRRYNNMAESIADRSAYFIGAMVGDEPRYPDINEIVDAEEQCRAIKAGGYATDVHYVDKLLSLIERFDLTQYDLEGEPVSNNVLVKAAESMDIAMKAEKKAGFEWTYTNRKKMSETFEEACETGNRKTNCSRGVNWILTEAGIFDEFPGRFYGKKGGTIYYQDKATMDRILSVMDVISIKTKTAGECVKDGTIQAGDIVTYMDVNHTNMYLGSGKWFDTGHAYCSGSGEGAVFNAWIGDAVHAGRKVGCIMRLKAEDGKTYRVQVGSYSVKANALAQMETVRDATGYGCFVEEIDGQYKVFCGSFEVKANAEAREAELEAKHIDAFIVEA